MKTRWKTIVPFQHVGILNQKHPRNQNKQPRTHQRMVENKPRKRSNIPLSNAVSDPNELTTDSDGQNEPHTYCRYCNALIELVFLANLII